MTYRTSDILTPRRILWLALVTVLAASAVHVAGTFSTLEPGGALPVLARLGPYTGVLAAVAVDLGLLGLSWGVGARKRDKPGETPYDLWGGIAIFAVLSALANFDHALSVLGAAGETSGAATWVALDWYTRVKVVALSATLPLLAIYLTRVVETAVDARQDRAREDIEEDEDEDEDAPAGQNVRADNTDFLDELARYNAARDRGDPNVLPPTPRVTVVIDRLASHDDDDEPPTHANEHAAIDVPELDPPVHINGVGTITVPPGAPPYLPQVKPAGPRRGTGPAKLTPERYRDIAAEHVLPGTGAQEADRIVARVAGTSTKTAQRARLAM